MLSTLSSFSDCISLFEILLQETRSDFSKTKIKADLIDGSVIFLREIIIQNVLFDYSYHWQKPDNDLILRWENAPHYPGISTHPHHKHVGQEVNVQPSYEQNLFQVFSFIKNELSKTVEKNYQMFKSAMLRLCSA